jgi:hypothetical protein
MAESFCADCSDVISGLMARLLPGRQTRLFRKFLGVADESRLLRRAERRGSAMLAPNLAWLPLLEGGPESPVFEAPFRLAVAYFKLTTELGFDGVALPEAPAEALVLLPLPPGCLLTFAIALDLARTGGVTRFCADRVRT